MKVSDLLPFLTVSELFWSLKSHKWLKKIQNTHETFRNVQKKRSCNQSGTAVTLNGQERLGTFESEHNNALE
jgi:hypothetical protein